MYMYMCTCTFKTVHVHVHYTTCTVSISLLNNYKESQLKIIIQGINTHIYCELSHTCKNCTCTYHVIKKFNRSESAQKIHASRNGCIMHVH